MNEIRIDCKAAELVSIDDLVIIQKDLKSLSKENYLKLKLSIEKNGFSFAIHVWKDRTGRLNVLDGTQRLKVVRKMVEEGWDCPLVPIAYVEASSRKEAIQKLLSGASYYGTPEEDGFHELIHLEQIEVEEVEFMALPGMSRNKYEAGQKYLEERPRCDKCGQTLKGVAL